MAKALRAGLEPGSLTVITNVGDDAEQLPPVLGLHQLCAGDVVDSALLDL